MTRPEALARYIKMKYSPGWPFIGSYKSRSELWGSGWGSAIAEAANHFLRAGQYPDPTWHAFAKMQVVDGDKLAGGKALRTVVAQDLTTSFIDHALFLEASKRPLGAGHDYVLGDALNEAGLQGHFEAVAKRRFVAGFDAVEHDSRMAPLLFEGLAEMAKRGYAWAGSRGIENMISQRYARIQKGNIHILQTGEVVSKLRGGGTGQSQTTRNNTDGLEIAILGGWSVLTGRPATEFWDNHTMRIAGDNGLLGWDDPDFSLEDLARVVQDLYGVELGYDMVASGGAMEFLSKLAVPGSNFAAEYIDRQLPIPRFAVLHDPAKLALRRSGMSARLAAVPLDQHLRGRLMRTAGHAALVAHQPDWYDRLANDWMEDVALLLKTAPEDDPFIVHLDTKGHIIGATLNPALIPIDEAARQNARWVIKKGRLLSYDEVFTGHLKAQSEDRPRVRHRKVVALRAVQPTIVVFTARMERLSAAAKRYAPTWLARMAADRSLPPLTLAVASGDHRLERWVWTMVREQKSGEEPTWGEWTTTMNVSPFANVVDGPGFRSWVDMEGGAQTLLSDTPDKLGGYAILLVAAYIMINLGARNVQRGSLLSVCSSLFLFYSIDLVRAYSMLALLYWLGTGTSSATISALVPRDPYWLPKRLSHILVSLVPDRIVAIIPWRSLTKWLPGLTKWAAEFKLLWPGQRVARAVARREGRVKWVEAAQEVVLRYGSSTAVKYLAAPTSCGKSTEFVAMLHAELTNQQVWLILPSRFGRDSYSNPWFAGGIDRVPTGGKPNPTADLVIMTYGQLLAHSSLAREVKPWLLLDEMHLGTPEQVECDRIFDQAQRLFMSATTRHDLYPGEGTTLNVDLKRGGVVHEVNIEGSLEELTQRALETCRTQGTRMMVQVVGRKEATNLAEMLTKGGHPAVAITSMSRSAPPDVHLVGTAVVGVGVNIRPAPGVGVTSGVELLNDRGSMRLTWTTPATHIQQKGRYGRDSEATFYAPPKAGTGRPATPYPLWRLYTSSLAAHTHYNTVYGLNHQMPQNCVNPELRVGRGADLSEIVDGDRRNDRDRNGLMAIYPFLTVCESVSQALLAYTTWVTTGGLATGCEQVASELYNLDRSDLLSHREARNILGDRPFVVNVGGVMRRHAGLKLKGWIIVPLPER